MAAQRWTFHSHARIQPTMGNDHGPGPKTQVIPGRRLSASHNCQIVPDDGFRHKVGRAPAAQPNRPSRVLGRLSYNMAVRTAPQACLSDRDQRSHRIHQTHITTNDASRFRPIPTLEHNSARSENHSEQQPTCMPEWPPKAQFEAIY